MLVLTTYETDDHILAAIEAGASGYLLKAAPQAEILAGIRAVAAGETVLAPSIAAKLVSRVRADAASAPPSLSPRELEVLRLVAEGRSNPEIARSALHRRGDGEDAPAARLREARGERPHARRDAGDGARAALSAGRAAQPPDVVVLAAYAGGMAFRNLRVAVRRTRILPKWVRRADAAAGRAVNRRHTHPNVDRFWSRLTGFADRGVLWWTLAGVLAVTGRRRAAARGLASLLAASALTNLIAKQVFGGDRPLLADVPIGRHLPKPPITPSFPSGHSASAAAFAAGVAFEDPRIGAAIAPVALGVGYSRLHTGAHWLSDVAGGLALGAGVAGLGALVVRPRHGEPKPQRPSGVDRPLPASPDGDGVYIVVNRSAGTSVLRPDPAQTLAERLPRAELHLLDGGDPGEAARAALARDDPPRILGICGGDGSVAAVAHEARAAGLPLLVVPGGTFNHFARTAGAASVDLAIDALQRGEGVRADVGELAFGDEAPITVLNTASVGIYPDFVVEREQREDRLGKWLAAIVAAARVLRRSRPVTIVMNGRRAEVWTLFVGVGVNDPGIVAPLQRRRLDGGVLDVRVLHMDSRVRAAASLAFGRRMSAVFRALRLLPQRIEAFTATSLEVIVRPREGQPPGFAHDGEVALDAPAEATAAYPGHGYRTRITIAPGALDVYRPASGRRRPLTGNAVNREFCRGAGEFGIRTDRP